MKIDMKPLSLFFFLLSLLLVVIITETILPSIAFLGQVHLVLFPIIFCFAALVLSFSGALSFGIITGFIEGLLVMHIQDQHVEIGIGWFIIFFIFWAFLLQCLSDMMTGVRWELHALATGLCTVIFLLGEFLLLTCSRGNFSLTRDVLFLSFLPAGISFLLAPLFYGLLQFLLNRPPHINPVYLSPL